MTTVNSGPNVPIASALLPGLPKPKASALRPILPAPQSSAFAQSHSQNGYQAQQPLKRFPTSGEMTVRPQSQSWIYNTDTKTIKDLFDNSMNAPARPERGRVPKPGWDTALYAVASHSGMIPDSAPCSPLSTVLGAGLNPYVHNKIGGKGGVSLASARGPVGIKKSLATKHEHPPKVPNGDKKGKAPVYPKQNSPPISSPDRPRAPVANMYGDGEVPLPDIPLGPGNWIIEDGGDDNDSVVAINTPNESECSGSSVTLPRDLVDGEDVFGLVDGATNYGDCVIELEPKNQAKPDLGNLVPATNVHDSLKIASSGKFQLGSQWQVPDIHTAHNNAGPSKGQVAVWSEHDLEVEKPVRCGIWDMCRQQQRCTSGGSADLPVPPNSPDITYIKDTVLLQEGPLVEDLTMSGALDKNDPKPQDGNHH